MSNKDYTKYSNNKVEVKTEAVVEEVVDTVVEETIKRDAIGVVVDCLKLNVREQPNPTASVVCVVDASTNLMVIEEESTDDFYAVCTESGAEGYCMKRYIQIIP